MLLGKRRGRVCGGQRSDQFPDDEGARKKLLNQTMSHHEEFISMIQYIVATKEMEKYTYNRKKGLWDMDSECDKKPKEENKYCIINMLKLFMYNVYIE